MTEPFQPKFADLVRVFTTTQGTVPFVPGAAVSGFKSFQSALGAGDRFYYCAVHEDRPSEREIGRGTLQANGTITREPVSGSLTNFSSGTKVIALVAAAEWYQAIAGRAAVTARSQLAAIAAVSPGQRVPLAEPGREGEFEWSGANLSAKVAIDPQQGVHVAPAFDPSGASGAWVRTGAALTAEMFGAKGDGTTNDCAALNAAFTYLGAIGGGALRLASGRSYWSFGYLDLKSKVRLLGNGSRIVGECHIGVAADVDDVEIRDLVGLTTTGNIYNILFQIYGTNVRFINTEWAKNPVGRGTIGRIWPGAKNISFDGFKCWGSHGIIVHGVDGLNVTNFHMRNGSLDGMTDPPDDCWAINGDETVTKDIVITNGRVEGYYNAVAVGTTIGKHAADDPTYSFAVRNMIVSNVVARDCYSLAYIKPCILRPNGDGEDVDWRHGLVENVRFENCQIESNQIYHALLVEAGRGAIVREVHFNDISIVGRAQTGGWRGALTVRPWNLAPAAQIERIYARSIHVKDSFGAAAEGTAGTVGAPIEYGVYIDREVSSTGLGDVGLVDVEDIHVNGVKRAACYVGPGLTGPFRIKGLRATNVGVGAPSLPANGVYASSKVEILDAKVALAPTAPSFAEPVGGATSSILLTGERALCFAGTVATNGNADFPWVAPRDCRIVKIEAMATSAVVQDDVNYKTLRALNRQTGAAFTSITTKTSASGGVALGANVPVSLGGTVPFTGASAFLPKGQVLNLQAIHPGGTGVGIAGLTFAVHYVPYGEA